MTPEEKKELFGEVQGISLGEDYEEPQYRFKESDLVRWVEKKKKEWEIKAEIKWWKQLNEGFDYSIFIKPTIKKLEQELGQLRKE